MTGAPSTSVWQWHPEYSLYFNPHSRTWAKVLDDGSWEYAPANGTQDGHKDDKKTDSRTAVSYDDVDEGDVRAVEELIKEAKGEMVVPAEQVWPGDDDETDPVQLDPYAKAPLLRLVVHHPRPPDSVLPLSHCVATLDPSEPVSLGRDKSFERRIRLRELAVSKTHATVFWSVEPELEEGGYWALVDNGSTHGTFLSSEGVGKTRLSEAKVASMPHKLHHLDTLHIGSTTFSIHLHRTFACSACSVASDSSNLIPLTSSPSDDPSAAPTNGYTGHKTKEEKEQDRKDLMKGLKEKLLKPAVGSPSSSSSSSAATSAKPASASTSSPAYINRAAARRQRDGPSQASPSSKASKTPRTAVSTAAPSPFFTVPGPAASFSVAPTSAAKVDPFGAESKGAQMLSKLSSASSAPGFRRGGTRLGTLIQPRTVDTSGSVGGGDRGGEASRAGLGSRKLVQIEQIAASAGGGGKAGEKRDWREDVREASRKRFREMG
ncbi:hypothetical protein JCM8547_008703 [Rhodosporidiobolus lusitaniae]